MLPHQPFFHTPEQRVALARQRYFEEGQRPSGLVGEAVIQSWSRCRQARRDPHEHVETSSVSSSRLHSTLNRCRSLLAAAEAELGRLEEALAGTGCRALLTDPHGIVVHATRNHDSAHDQLLLAAARPGVNLSESAIGSNAPGIVAHTGLACTVTAAEHYFDNVHRMYCAAAPIHDAHGQLAAVLDVSIEARPFGFDAASLVLLYATTIENRLLAAQAHEQLLLNFQASPALLGTPLEGLAGVSGEGRVAWLNREAVRLTGQPAAGQDAEAVFGVGLEGLLQHAGRGTGALRLPNGLMVWVRARVQGQAGDAARAEPGEAPQPAAGAAPHAPTLADHSREHIARTLADCHGNISRAARQLGVSRGLLYRRLRADG